MDRRCPRQQEAQRRQRTFSSLSSSLSPPLTVPIPQSGVVQSVTTTADGKQRIHFSFGYYTFDAEVTPDHNTLFLTMRNPSGAVAGPIDLAAMHVNPAAVSSVTVYTGRLEWYSYAKGEATALVVPYGVVDGAFFGLYHQWTVDSGGVENANHPVNGMFQDAKYGADGTITAKFSASYYTYNFTFRGKEGSWVLSNPRGGISEGNKLAVAYEL